MFEHQTFTERDAFNAPCGALAAQTQFETGSLWAQLLKKANTQPFSFAARWRRATVKCAVPLSCFIALCAAQPSIAYASCNECFSARQNVQEEKTKLALAYPGTVTTLAICAASCSEQPTNGRAACIFFACSFACLAIGAEHCGVVIPRMAGIMDREKRVGQFCAARRCN
ncbi:MAG: hypothetical protein AAFR64_14245 [Pseudomonadota bacterium]